MAWLIFYFCGEDTRFQSCNKYFLIGIPISISILFQDFQLSSLQNKCMFYLFFSKHMRLQLYFPVFLGANFECDTALNAVVNKTPKIPSFCNFHSSLETIHK